MDADSSFQEYNEHIQTLLRQTTNDEEMFESIVNAPFYNKLHATSIDLGMIVFVLVNTANQTIDRISYSKTPPAIDAVKASPLEFNNIKIPIKNRENITAKAIRKGKPYKTSDWRYLLTPALSPDASRFNQAEAGIGCSFVYPLVGARNGGALIYSFYQSIDMIGEEHISFMEKYTKFVATRLNSSTN